MKKKRKERKMNKERPTYYNFRLRREQMKLRILKQELLIKSGFKELSGELTFTSLKRRLLEKLVDRPGTAFHLGMKAISFLTGKRKRKRR
jgi:hypothetical protein